MSTGWTEVDDQLFADYIDGVWVPAEEKWVDESCHFVEQCEEMRRRGELVGPPPELLDPSIDPLFPATE